MFIFFKYLIKKLSYEKPIQLTQNSIFKNKLIHNFIKLLSLIFLYTIINTFIDFKTLFSIIAVVIESTFYNFLAIIDYFCFFNKNDDWFNIVYYAPITNSRSVLYEKTFIFLEFFIVPMGNFKNHITTFFYEIFNNINKEFMFNFRKIIIILIFFFFLGFFYFNFFKYFYLFFILFFIFYFIFIIFNDDLLYKYVLKSNLWYSNFKIVESFVNRNLYVDSNYFLTSNSLFGIEKFSDVSVPWLVDYEDSGWGPDFDIQEQLSQIIEKERKFIINEVNVETSPHLENFEIQPGSLSARLRKAKYRIFVFFRIFDDYLNTVSDIINIWKNTYKYRIETRNEINKSSVKNIFRKNSKYKMSTFYSIYKTQNKNIFFNPKNSRRLVKHYIPKIEISNDFVLPKKNNITNENFNKIGNIGDRKQMVYRKLINKVDSVESKYDLRSKIPDLSNISNYVFERQLQESRSVEYSLKEYLKFRLFRRLNFYYFSQFEQNSKKIKIIDFNKQLIYTPIYNFFFKKSNLGPTNKTFLKPKLPNYESKEIHLEYLLKYWQNHKNMHNTIFSRDVEFVYFKNSEKNITNFFEYFNILDYSMEELLKANRLGIGMYTYQSFESPPWFSQSDNNNDYLYKLISERSKKNIITWFEKKNKDVFFFNLKYFVESNFFNLTPLHKKQIMLSLSVYSLKIWFDFENKGIILDYNDLFKLSVCELFIKNKKGIKLIDYNIINVYIKTLENLLPKYSLNINKINYFLNIDYSNVKRKKIKISQHYNQKLIDILFNRSYFIFYSIKLEDMFIIKRFNNKKTEFERKFHELKYGSFRAKYQYNFIINMPIVLPTILKKNKVYTNYFNFIKLFYNKKSTLKEFYYFDYCLKMLISNYKTILNILSEIFNANLLKFFYNLFKIKMNEIILYILTINLYAYSTIFLTIFKLKFKFYKIYNNFSLKTYKIEVKFLKLNFKVIEVIKLFKNYFLFFFKNINLEILNIFNFKIKNFINKNIKYNTLFNFNYIWFFKNKTFIDFIIISNLYLDYYKKKLELLFFYLFFKFLKKISQTLSMYEFIVNSNYLDPTACIIDFIYLKISCVLKLFIKITNFNFFIYNLLNLTNNYYIFFISFCNLQDFNEKNIKKINKIFFYYKLNLTKIFNWFFLICFDYYSFLKIYKNIFLIINKTQIAEYYLNILSINIKKTIIVFSNKNIEKLKYFKCNLNILYNNFLILISIFYIFFNNFNLYILYYSINLKTINYWIIFSNIINNYVKTKKLNNTIFIENLLIVNTINNFIEKDLLRNNTFNLYKIFYKNLVKDYKQNYFIDNISNYFFIKNFKSKVFLSFFKYKINVNNNFIINTSNIEYTKIILKKNTMFLNDFSNLNYKSIKYFFNYNNSCKLLLYKENNKKFIKNKIKYYILNNSEEKQIMLKFVKYTDKFSIWLNKIKIKNIVQNFYISKNYFIKNNKYMFEKFDYFKKNYKNNNLSNFIFFNSYRNLNDFNYVKIFLNSYFNYRFRLKYAYYDKFNLFLKEYWLNTLVFFSNFDYTYNFINNYVSWFFKSKKYINYLNTILNKQYNYIHNYDISIISIVKISKNNNYINNGNNMFSSNFLNNLINTTYTYKHYFKKISKFNMFGGNNFDLWNSNRLTKNNWVRNTFKSDIDQFSSNGSLSGIINKKDYSNYFIYKKNIIKKINNDSNFLNFEIFDNSMFNDAVSFYFFNYIKNYNKYNFSNIIFKNTKESYGTKLFNNKYILLFSTSENINPIFEHKININIFNIIYNIYYILINYCKTNFSILVNFQKKWYFDFWEIFFWIYSKNIFLISFWKFDFNRNINFLKFENKINFKYGIFYFNIGWIRNIILNLVWFDYLYVFNFFFNNFNNFNNIYNFTLLERQNTEIFINLFYLNKNIHHNVFDLVKIISIWYECKYWIINLYYYIFFINREFGYIFYIIFYKFLNLLHMLFYNFFLIFVIKNIEYFSLYCTCFNNLNYDLWTISLIFFYKIKNILKYDYFYGIVDDDLLVPITNINLEFLKIKEIHIVNWSKFLKLVNFYFHNFTEILKNNFFIFKQILIVSEIRLENENFSILNIINQIYFEWFSVDNLSHVFKIFRFYDIFEDVFDIIFNKFVFSYYNFFEFYGQLFWLDLCIFFDFIFEQLVEFDYRTDINPFSEIIYGYLEFLRSLLSGNESDNFVSHLLNFFDRDFKDDIDDDDHNHFGSNSDNLGDDSSHGMSDLDDFDGFEFLGWGFNVNLGTDPGNEFSTINDIIEFPAEIEKFMLTDISDFYNNLFGLDSPKIGSIAPSFDITLPINSLWLIDVIYYNPKFGGILFINFESLCNFFKILYLDRRVSFFSKIYNILDFTIFDFRENLFIFFKIKINYLYIDFFQIMDSLYFNPFDFLYLIIFYLIFLTSYWGIWLPITIYLVMIYFYKFNKYFEKTGRNLTNNSLFFLNIISQTYSYLLFRFIYHIISNSFIFIKMTFSVVLFLNILYLFTEGFHLFSVLRLYTVDQESLFYTNGLFFNLERDPFVEKHTPVDEMWDQFKYESSVDDEWSRIHYHRENSEILGGPISENPVVLDSVGFVKNIGFLHYLNELDTEFNSSVSRLTKAIPQQIHNRQPDEESFTPRFVKDSVLEREFFRESELYGPEIEGSLDWYNRSLNTIADLYEIENFNDWFSRKHIIDSDSFVYWNWGYSSDNEDYNNDLYDALLLNIADPKWVWNESNIFSEIHQKPIIFSQNKSQLYNPIIDKSENNLHKNISTYNRVNNLIERNRGFTHQSPILDLNDEDPLFDLGIDNYLLFGSSLGTLSNSKSVYDDATSDILTQKIKYTDDVIINSPILLNYANRDDSLDIDYSKNEEILLDNFFDTIYYTKLNKNSLKNYSEITEKFYNKFRRRRVENFNSFDNFHTKIGKNWILENNFKIKKLVKDGIPEGYFNITSYVFRDLSNSGIEVPEISISQNLSLENIRRRDFQHVNLEGKDPNIIFYDEMLGDDIDKLTFVNLSNMRHPLHNHNTKFFTKDEYLIKFDLSEQNSMWTSLKWPRTRWKWFRKWGFDSPYQDFSAGELDEDTVEEFAIESGLDKTILKNFQGINISEEHIKKKKYNIKKQRKPFAKFLLINNDYNKIKFKTIFTSWYKNTKNKIKEISNKDTISYNLNSGLSSWVNTNPLNYKNNINILKIVKKSKIFDKKHIDKNNNVILISKFNKFSNSIITNDKNYNYILNKLKNLGSIFYNNDVNDFYENPKNSINGSQIGKQIFVENIKKYYKNNNYNKVNFNIFKNFYIKNHSINKFINSKLILNKDLKILKKKNIKPFFNKIHKIDSLSKNKKKIVNINFSYLQNNKNIFNDYDNFLNIFLKKKKNYIWNNLKKNNKNITVNIFENHQNKDRFVNSIFNKKIQEFIIELDNISYSDEFKYDTGLVLNSKLKNYVFKNNKNWFLDNNQNLNYRIISNKKLSSISNKLLNLKESGKLKKNFKKKLLKTHWESRKSRRFFDSIGKNVLGNEWPLSLRMHALKLQKYSEDPIQVNDTEAFQDYVEMWNPNFSRRYNNLNTFGEGSPRNLEYFIEYNHNPYEMARVYSDPVWFDDDDDFSINAEDEYDIANFDKEEYDDDNSDWQGISESNLDVDDSIRYLGYWGGFNISKGDNYFDLIGTSIGSKLYNILSSKYLNSKINWYKPTWVHLHNIVKKPWGFDFNNRSRWYGTQHWRIQKNLDSLNSLFSSGNFRIFGKNNPDLEIAVKKKVKLGNFFENNNLKKQLNLDIFGINSKKEKLYNSKFTKYYDNLDNFNKWSTDNVENVKKNLTYNNLNIPKNINQNLSDFNNILKNSDDFSKIIKKKNERNIYNIEIVPEHYFSSIDRSFDSEFKHDWRTKFYQYGKMFKSLEQNFFIQDYFKNYIPLGSRSVTPRKLSDYFWQVYVQHKKNRHRKFYKDYNFDDRENSTTNKLKINRWSDKLRNPNNYNISEFYDSNELQNHNTTVKKFPNIGVSWITGEVFKKLKIPKNTLNSKKFNAFTGNFLIYENINKKNKIKSKNLKLRDSLNKNNLKYKNNSLKKNLYGLVIKDWNSIFNILEYSNNLIYSKNNKYYKPKLRYNSKTLKVNRENFLFNYLFGNNSINNKYKHGIFEVNASTRFSLLEKLKYNNIKNIPFNYFNNKFKSNININKNVSDSIRNIYEIPYSYKLKIKNIDYLNNNDNLGLTVSSPSNENSENYDYNSVRNQNYEFNNFDILNYFKFKKNILKNLHIRNILPSHNVGMISNNSDSLDILDFVEYDSIKYNLDTINDNILEDIYVNQKKNNFKYPISIGSDVEDFYFPENISNNFNNFNFGNVNSNSWVNIYTNNNLSFLKKNKMFNTFNTIFSKNIKLNNFSENTKNTPIFESKNNFNIQNDIGYDLNNSDLLFSNEFGQQYYYNKKINTNENLGLDYRSIGTVKPVSLKRLKISIKNNLNTNNLLTNTNFRYNNLDNDFQLAENQSIFSNKLYYDKNSLSTRLKNLDNSIIKILNNLNVSKKLNVFSQDNSYISKNLFNDGNIGENSITNYLLNIKNDFIDLNKSINNINKSKTILKKEPIKYIINSVVGNNKSLKNLILFKFYNQNSKINEYNSKTLSKNFVKLDSKLIKKKLSIIPNTSKIQFNPNIPEMSNYTNFLNKKKIGIKKLSSIFNDILYIDKSQKIEPSFGNTRFKEKHEQFTNQYYSGPINFKLNNKTTFNYGLSNNNSKFYNSKIVKSEFQHFFKYKDNTSYSLKNIGGFFNSIDKDINPTNNYIYNVAIPIYKNFNKKKNNENSTFIFTENNKKLTYSSDKYNNFKNNKLAKFNNDYGINDIFRNSKIKINSKKSKISTQFKKFSANETIYPLPISTSLSINSKLFNKINSLRIFSLGKLQDYLYKPKLKHLVKNQSNFYNYNESIFLNDSSIKDDKFLYKFENNEYDNDIGEFSENQYDYYLKKKYYNKNINNIVNYNKKLNLLFNYAKTNNEQNDFLIHMEHNFDSNQLFNKLSNDLYNQNEFSNNYEYSDINLDLNDSTEFQEYSLDDYFFNYNDKIQEQYSNRLIFKDIFYNSNMSLVNKNKKSDILRNLEKFNFIENVDQLEYFDDLVDFDKHNNENYINKISNESNLFINKDFWLFNLYKNINRSENKKNNLLSDNKIKFKNYLLNIDESEDISLEFSRNKNSNYLSNLNNALNSTLNTQEYELLPINDQFSDSRDAIFNVNNINNLENEENLKFKIFSDINISENFNNPFESNSLDLEDLQEFLLERFENIEIPITKKENYISNIFDYSDSENILNLSNLNFRQNNLDFEKINFEKQLKSNFKNKIIKQKLSDNISDVLWVLPPIVRSLDVKLKNWNLEQNVLSEILDEYYENSDDLYVENQNNETNIFKKLINMDNLQSSNLKTELSNYFIKKQFNILIDGSTEIFDNKTLNDFYTLKNNKNLNIVNYDKNIIFKNIWNIYQTLNTSSSWKNKKSLKSILQNNDFDKNSSLNLINKLNLHKNNYIFKKNILNIKNNKNSTENLKTLIRKSNSISEAQFGRRKYKKLKKKYWNRLDILEKYINHIKNSINLRYKKHKLNYCEYVGKPIQIRLNKVLLKKPQFVNSLKNFTIDSESTTYVDYENTDKLLYNNKYIFNDTIFKYINKNKNFLIKNPNNITDLKLFKNKIIKPKFNKFSNFENIISNKLQNTELIPINFLNSYNLDISNANYLLFKFNNLNSSKLSDTILDRNFEDLEQTLNTSDNSESEIIAYSKIRNDIPKLQLSKFGNSYLPLSIISTFLNKLPNINFNEYLDEINKPVNYYIKKEKFINNPIENVRKKINYKKNKRSFNKLNSIRYFKKLPVIDQFAIYNKNLKRPGLSFKNKYSKLPTNPFRHFKNLDTLYQRSLNYGLSDYIYKNSPVNRRSYDLALRKFGPDIRTNSTMRGYGMFDDITDFNLNSEEDSGLHNNLGYPILNEQNLYVYDFPDLLPYFGGSIYTDKFLGFMWDNEYDSEIDDEIEEEKMPDGLYSEIPIFGYMSNNSDISEDEYENELFQGSVVDLFSDLKLVLETPDEEGLDYNFSPTFSRYVQIWNSTIPRKYLDREDMEEYYEDPMYNDLFSRDLNEEHVEDTYKHSYMHSIRKDSPYDIISSFELSTNKIWDKYQSKNLNGPIFEEEVTINLSKDYDEKNIGPLGYEEGDSLYDNRMLNRGWFPEKLIWNWGLRSNSKVGSDAQTLELLSDYSSSFAHDLDNFGNDPDLEGLKNLNWAGKDNKIFNTIDDIVEGIGIEENIPFKPDIAKALWEWDEYLERPTYDKFDLEPFEFNEDDEDEFYWNWEEPMEYHQFKDNNFNTLGLNNYIAETNSWKDSNYLGNLDSAFIPGVSLALADKEIYDGLISDFASLLYEKFPNNENSIFFQPNLPQITSGLFRYGDFTDSIEPSFANYVTNKPLEDDWQWRYNREYLRKDKDQQFNILETFKPKDTFNFAPIVRNSLNFEPEWVINGEGWLGNSGSNLPIVSNKNLPISYIDPVSNLITQPKGIHSFKVNDDMDDFGGIDSPYFSLSDHQLNRIIRGRDNDVSNFPINSGWNMISRIIPSSLNTFWSHRAKSRSFNIYDENNYDKFFSEGGWDNWEEEVSIISGEGYNFSKTLEDNPDFLVFNTSALNQRDLWWKSIRGGFLTPKSQSELSSELISDRSEKFRDFITSYDYRIFGKSWINPQEVQMPLKSFNFYGDSQINTFLGYSDDFLQHNLENQETNASRLILDFTYGHFRSSQMNFDLNINFYGVRLRIFLYKIFNIVNFYLSSSFSIINWKFIIFLYTMCNLVLFKVDFITNYYYNVNYYNFYFYYYFLLPIFYIFKKIIVIIMLLFYYLIKIQIFLTIHDNSVEMSFFYNLINDLIYFTLHINYLNYFKLFLIIFKYFLLYIIFILILTIL